MIDDFLAFMKTLDAWVSTRQHPPKRFQPRAPMAYDSGMEARVAVLEQIAKDNRDMMARLETKMDAGFAKSDVIADRR